MKTEWGRCLAGHDLWSVPNYCRPLRYIRIHEVARCSVKYIQGEGQFKARA